MYFLLRCPLCILIAFGLMTMKHSSCAFRGGRFIFPSDFLWFFFHRKAEDMFKTKLQKKNKTKQKNSNFVILCVLQVFVNPWGFGTLSAWHENKGNHIKSQSAVQKVGNLLQYNWIFGSSLLTKQDFIKRKKSLNPSRFTKIVFFL